MEPDSIGFVYVWYDRLKRKLYVGSHWGDPLDGYVCSSAYMKRAYRHRPQHFMRRIVYRTTNSRQELLDKEHEWLRLIPDDQLGSRFYNLHNGKPGHWMARDGSVSTCEKISREVQKFWNDPVRGGPARKRASELSTKTLTGRKRKPFTEEHKTNIRAARLGTKASPEAKANIRRNNGRRGKTNGPKQREAMRQMLTDPVRHAAFCAAVKAGRASTPRPLVRSVLCVCGVEDLNSSA